MSDCFHTFGLETHVIIFCIRRWHRFKLISIAISNINDPSCPLSSSRAGNSLPFGLSCCCSLFFYTFIFFFFWAPTPSSSWSCGLSTIGATPVIHSFSPSSRISTTNFPHNGISCSVAFFFCLSLELNLHKQGPSSCHGASWPFSLNEPVKPNTLTSKSK